MERLKNNKLSHSANYISSVITGCDKVALDRQSVNYFLIKVNAAKKNNHHSRRLHYYYLRNDPCAVGGCENRLYSRGAVMHASESHLAIILSPAPNFVMGSN